MDKETILKAFYISQITKLIERCTDTDLLDFIHGVLTQTQGEKNK